MTEQNRDPQEQQLDPQRRQPGQQHREQDGSSHVGPKVGENVSGGVDTGGIQPGKTQGANQA
jgi:hypothetical protein